MHDPESLYRLAKYRLDEVHAAAELQSKVHRARAQATGYIRMNHIWGVPRFVKRLLVQVQEHSRFLEPH
jgi:hypothetical protein